MCLCCGVSGARINSGSYKEDLRPFRGQSWMTFLDAGSKRKDNVLREFLERENDTDCCFDHPRGLCYKSCYTRYTSKHNVRLHERRVTPSLGLSKEKQRHVAPHTASRPISEGLRSRCAPTNYNLCLFCQPVKRSGKNRRSTKPLVTCTTENAAARVREAAEIFGNRRFQL